MTILHVCILAAAAWALVALLVLRMKAKAFGKRELFAAPAGDPAAGVRYAFTKGMRPGAKESVRENPASYAAGMAYHTGIFTVLGLLGLEVAGLRLPAPLRPFAMGLLGIGVLGGLALLVKRVVKPTLRGLSNPDDYLSNLLATATVALGLCALLDPTFAGAWMIASILLLVWAPLGKIRHCLFFFTTRAAMGAFFGRRGVFPTQ